MAMGKRQDERQGDLWVATQNLPVAPGNPFYAKLNELLAEHGFEAQVEELCRPYYAEEGRPSIPPGVYFRMLLIGYFEGLDSERGIAWRTADSLGLRQFLGYALTDGTPDHSSLSYIRRRLPLEVHQQVFTNVLAILAKSKLLKGKTLGVDATTLEANAALKSIVRRDTGESYQEFLTKLARESGIETPTKDDLIKLDKKRKNKGNNAEWYNPYDPDARIGKMKDGSTHLMHKCEAASDLETGAVVGITVQAGDLGDTTTGHVTVDAAAENLTEVGADEAAGKRLFREPVAEVVKDKGYHANAMLKAYAQIGVRTYISEPERGRRRWKDLAEERAAVYANRRRIRGSRGKRLMRKRAEICERLFAHLCDSGGLRRTWLKGHENIRKRLLIHTSGFNLSLVMRKRFGLGKPRGIVDQRWPISALLAAFWTWLVQISVVWAKITPTFARLVIFPRLRPLAA